MSNSQQNNAVAAVQCSAIVMCPTFDADGYPTEETKFAIKTWDFRDAPGWLTYIREAWNHHYGQMWEEGGLLKLATGGWSGNEAITHAMRENYALWSLLWESSHRGGLEVLKMPNIAPAKMNTVTVHSTAEIKHGLCMSREGWVKAADHEEATAWVRTPNAEGWWLAWDGRYPKLHFVTKVQHRSGLHVFWNSFWRDVETMGNDFECWKPVTLPSYFDGLNDELTRGADSNQPK